MSVRLASSPMVPRSTMPKLATLEAERSGFDSRCFANSTAHNKAKAVMAVSQRYVDVVIDRCRDNPTSPATATYSRSPERWCKCLPRARL